jgi:hypothetical protein
VPALPRCTTMLCNNQVLPLASVLAWLHFEWEVVCRVPPQGTLQRRGSCVQLRQQERVAGVRASVHPCML